MSIVSTLTPLPDTLRSNETRRRRAWRLRAERQSNGERTKYRQALLLGSARTLHPSRFLCCSHVQIVLDGYGNDAASGLNYYLIRNSWSASWGEKGERMPLSGMPRYHVVSATDTRLTAADPPYTRG